MAERGAGDGDGGGEPAETAGTTPKVRKARRKTDNAVRAMRRAEELSAAGAGALVELDKLRRSLDQLTQGLDAMLAVQATHTELLRQVLLAAAVPTDPEHAVAQLLEQVVAQLAQQGGQLRAIGAGLGRLPADVGSAVAREVSGALAQVR